MANRNENLKKINAELEKLTDEQLEQVAGGMYWIPPSDEIPGLSDPPDELKNMKQKGNSTTLAEIVYNSKQQNPNNDYPNVEDIIKVAKRLNNFYDSDNVPSFK